LIKIRVYREGEELTTVPVADLSEVRKEPDTLIWVDVVSPTEAELAAMGEEFDLHGMNFVHLPELQWRFGYAWALGLMVVSGVGLWLFFKRKNRL
jgi:Mg2+ and Co2+ transporter CorA